MVIDLPYRQMNDFLSSIWPPKYLIACDPTSLMASHIYQMNPEECIWMAGKSKCDLVEQSAEHQTRHISPNNREVNATMSRIPPYRCSN